ncbi:597_t:CDS:2, partial [Funneliformis mosseae]
DQDLNSFDWEKDNDDGVLNDGNKMCVEFEVKKSREDHEDFIVFNGGFNIPLPKIIKSEIEKSYNDELYPKVVESISYQAFITQNIIPPSNAMKLGTATIKKGDFNKEFMNRWEKCSVRIDRSTMDMQKLELLINYGLNMDYLKYQLNQYHDALKEANKELESKKENERLTIQEDAKTLKKLAYNKLKELYGRLESNEECNEKQKEQEMNKDIEIEKFFSKYSDLKVKFDAALMIKPNEWQILKFKFIYGSLLIKKVQTLATNNEKLDNNEDYFKYLGPKSSMKHELTFKITNNQINEYYKQAGSSFNSLDSEIIEKLFDQELCPNNSELREKIINLFRDSYNQWKDNTFSRDIDKIEPKWTDYNKKITKNLETQHKKFKSDIERNAFERLCTLIETKFPDGYTINYELDTVQPARLQITIYETVLEQEDCLKIQEDEFHVPNPELSTRANGKYGYSFTINPENEL